MCTSTPPLYISMVNDLVLSRFGHLTAARVAHRAPQASFSQALGRLHEDPTPSDEDRRFTSVRPQREALDVVPVPIRFVADVLRFPSHRVPLSRPRRGRLAVRHDRVGDRDDALANFDAASTIPLSAPVSLCTPESSTHVLLGLFTMMVPVVGVRTGGQPEQPPLPSTKVTSVE